MCGFLYTNRASDACDFQYALNTIKHRGPDSTGIRFSKTGTWGHVRLSLLDISSNSDQPVPLQTDQDDFLIFNGEIFNYLQYGQYSSDTLMLKDKLKTIKDSVDLKVFLNTLNGFFSFAYTCRDIFTLVRDRFGEKPAYIFLKGEHFSIASEIKALVALDNQLPNKQNLVRLAMDPFSFTKSHLYEGLYDTCYDNIYELRPGYFMLVDLSTMKIRVEPWYNLDADIQQYRDADFEEILEDAIAIRCKADVPGAFSLSGGVDSTLICAVAHNLLSLPTTTFSLNSSKAEYSEVAAISKCTRAISSSATVISEADYIESLSAKSIVKSIKHFDYPYFDPNIAQHSLYSKVRTSGFKYIVDGHGADELFSGYQWHLPYLFLSSLRKFHLYECAKSLFCYSNMHTPNYSASYKVASFGRGFLRALFMEGDKNETFFFSKPEPEARVRYIELFDRVLLRLLNNYDMTSMFNSIEIRAPFLDFRLVANILGKKNQFFVGTQNKPALRSFLFQISGLTVPTSKIGFRSYLWNHLSEHESKYLIDVYHAGRTFADIKTFSPDIKFGGLANLSPTKEMLLWKGISIGALIA